MRCYWCGLKYEKKQLTEAEAKIIGLPYLGIKKMSSSSELTLFFHRRECMVDWLNSEEDKNL